MQTLNRAVLELCLQLSLGFLLLLLILLSSGLRWDPSRCLCLRKPGAGPEYTVICYTVDWKGFTLPSRSLLFLSLNTGQGKKEKELKYLCSDFMLGILTILTITTSGGCVILIEETEVKQEIQSWAVRRQLAAHEEDLWSSQNPHSTSCMQP